MKTYTHYKASASYANIPLYIREKHSVGCSEKAGRWLTDIALELHLIYRSSNRLFLPKMETCTYYTFSVSFANNLRYRLDENIP